MIDRNTAHTACEAVWAAMVELAEAGNDLVISTQAQPSEEAAVKLVGLAEASGALASAAAHLARWSA
jgi:hypothetical protein